MYASDINIASLNCRGMNIHRGASFVANYKLNSIMEGDDITCLQETFLYEEEL